MYDYDMETCVEHGFCHVSVCRDQHDTRGDYWWDQRVADATSTEVAEKVNDHAAALVEQMRENGITFDMEAAEKVVATATVAQEIRHWYVTFGYEHRDPVTNVQLWHRYCIIEDTYEGARDQIMRRFGTGWAALYANANDLPVEERIVNGRELPEYKWRGAGVRDHGLTYFDHRMEESAIADKIELSREKAGYYEQEDHTCITKEADGYCNDE